MPKNNSKSQREARKLQAEKRQAAYDALSREQQVKKMYAHMDTNTTGGVALRQSRRFHKDAA